MTDDALRFLMLYCDVDLGSGLRGTVVEERPDDASTVLCVVRC